MKTVDELSREELVQLKQGYLTQLDDCGELEEAVEIDNLSYATLASVDEMVSDEFIMKHYAGVMFSPDDF